ncbi:hypothetical protein ACFE04_012415 [Oxalis oulophora]
MERKNTSFNMNMTHNNNNNMAKLQQQQNNETWNSGDHVITDDLLSGFSWPPRSYTCSFCKREFRSAQALGGHMNVHRRDRARLRSVQQHDSSPPPHENININNSTFLNLNQNPNPSPNYNYNYNNFSSFSPSDHFTFSPISCLSSPSTTATASPNEKGYSDYLAKMKTVKSSFDYPEDHECKFLKKKMKKNGNIVRLDLEIGFVGDESKEDLDLELRLGYSN